MGVPIDPPKGGNNQGSGIGMIGAQTASNLGAAIIGQIFNRSNMRAQQRNQMALMKQSQQYGKEMWDYTNYENQMEHIKNAGLNPGMLYGMGGAGGSTTGGMPGGNASGGQTPFVQGPNIMEIQMQQANIDLMKANTDKAKAEAEATRGYRAGLAGSQTELNKGKLGAIPYEIDELISRSNNQTAMTEWTNAKKAYQKLENELMTNTMQLKIDGMATALEIANSNARKAFQEAKIAEGTSDTIIKQASANLIKTGVETMLASEHINLSVQQRTQIAHSIEQKWTELWHRGKEGGIQQQRNQMQETLNQFNIDNSIKNDIMELLYGSANQINK